MRFASTAVPAGCALIVACSAGARKSATGAPVTGGAGPGESVTAQENPGYAAPSDEVRRPAGKLDRAQAEQYMLALINRDRATDGLAPVAWDETAARAGQIHADDMVRNGYTAHWGTDGSVPELRYTEVGGVHMVQENAGCFADGRERELDPRPQFEPAAIEKVEDAFFHERAPHDGHRKNILKRWHTHVGVGLAKAKGVDVVCVAQEFTDQYGTYDELPRSAKVGQKIRVSGAVSSPARLVGVGIARIAFPPRRTGAELLQTGTYPVPAPYVTYFPKGFVTPIPVTVQGSRFSIEVPLTDRGQKGLYQVSVWGEVPGTKDFVMISLRTIRVE